MSNSEPLFRQLDSSSGVTIRAGVYLRVSTTEQNTDLQKQELLDQAKRRGWEPVIYEDLALSGASTDRPNLNRMLLDVEQKKLEVIMAWKLDRIGRSTQHLATIINQLLRFDVGLVVPSQGIDTSAGRVNPASKLQLNVLAAVAEFERDLIRERTRAGMQAAKKRGQRFGRETVVRTDQKEAARKILALQPEISVNRLRKTIGLSIGTAARLRRLLIAEKTALYGVS